MLKLKLEMNCCTKTKLDVIIFNSASDVSLCYKSEGEQQNDQLRNYSVVNSTCIIDYSNPTSESVTI